jgi:hypothetical protein
MYISENFPTNTKQIHIYTIDNDQISYITLGKQEVIHSLHIQTFFEFTFKLI